MIKSIPFANAALVVGLGLYVVCRVLSLIVPDFLFSIGQSWFHTFSVESMRATVSFDIGMFIFGGASLAVVTWITVYAFVEIYNRLAKK
mgnify:CR=1 FL=1